MAQLYTHFLLDKIKLLPGLFQTRFELNRDYLLSLKNENILQNHYLEAGLARFQLRNTMHGRPDPGDDLHWGWESPTCQVRGQFLGHWLSAAGRMYMTTNDPALKLKADQIISELDRCQKKNGGEWFFSIPEKYLEWTAQGEPTWAPQYVLHKTLMGLFDYHIYAKNGLALDIIENAARWLHRWTKQFSREQFDTILDTETGGMLELWANMFGETKNPVYLELIERYTRARLFNPLLAGVDALTNMHANTTIPEIHGAARVYEVTGEKR
jgi:DUF1680 family protein